tara:strand:+ start:1935 stop:3815 length:1881 start_codon:yes stop_codon:yes gene_type:complete
LTIVSSLIKDCINSLQFEEPLTVSQWSDTYRVLSSKSSSEAGKWRTERTPYLKEPMDCLSTDNSIQRVVLQFASQTGKTEAGSNWLGYVISHSPGSMLMIQPTLEMAKRLSRQRLEGLISDTPILSNLVAPSRSRDSGNTMFSKDFPGGIMVLTGANSAVGLRSMPCRYIFMDEIDSFPTDIDNEGDAVSLAEKRTMTFSRRKILMTSTPTIRDMSRIEQEYLESDMRRFYIPCPLCGEYQYLQWSQVKWEDNDPKTAKYECEHCRGKFEERHKPEFLAKGEWRATAPFDGITAGFHLNGLYSPLGWKSWEEIVSDFIKAKSDAPRLKSFVNTVLGETWEEDYAAKVGTDVLMERVESYESNMIPEKAVVLTAGVDVQDNRLAISVWGWGRGEEGWLIDHQEIYGDPARSELWKQLDQLLLRPFRHELGNEFKPDIIAVDSGGHFTSEVYAYTRDRRKHGVIAIKGASIKDKPPIGKGKKLDLNWKGRVIKQGAELFTVGTDTIKTTLFSRLRHNDMGAGYLHFNVNADEEYFKQLTAEKQVIRYVKGFPIREWVKKSSARNEALDTLVYAYAALHRLYQKRDRRTIWDNYEERGRIKGKIKDDKNYLDELRYKKKAQKPKFVSQW